MANDSERIQILKMIEEGKISPAEGVRLLERGEASPKTSADEVSANGPRWLHVLITDATTGKTRVNVRLPVNLVNAGVKLGARLSTEMDEFNMEQISESIRNGYTGTVIDMVDDNEDEHVQIILE
jgi:hypothetical protein